MMLWSMWKRRNIKLLDAIEEAPEALARANSVLQDWISAQNTRPRF